VEVEVEVEEAEKGDVKVRRESRRICNARGIFEL